MFIIIRRLNSDLSVAHVIVGTTCVEEIILNNKERKQWQPLVKAVTDGMETVNSSQLRAYAV